MRKEIQWRKGSTVLTNIVLQSRACSFTLFNVQTNVTATIMVSASPTAILQPLTATNRFYRGVWVP
jgi:hypothetical protein